MEAPVQIVDYSPHWPEQYEREKARVLEAIPEWVVALEHVGSTAVPGLSAKPIIDIMIGIARLSDAEATFEPLRQIGYDYRPEFEILIPERRFFRKGPPQARTHHVHMVERDSAFWLDHLLFRDYLRSHPDVAKDYEALKRDLAAQVGKERQAYTDAKTPFIQGILRQARAEKLSD